MDDWYVTEAMERYGGGFVQVLGRLYRQADDDNRRRIREAWPEYWAAYTELARHPVVPSSRVTLWEGPRTLTPGKNLT